MPVGNLAAQQAKLRRAVGHQADTALISDDLLTDCLEDALNAVNRQWPLLAFGSFVTVADQQVYSVLPAGAYVVREVYWPQICGDQSWWIGGLQPEIEGLLGDTDELGFTYATGPALEASYFRYQTYLRKWFQGSSRILKPGTVYLMPTPATAGTTVYFLYSTARYAAVADVADAHEQPYWAYAQFQLHNVLSTGRGALQEVTSPLGVKVRTGAGLRHREAADRWRAEYRGYLPLLRNSRNSP